MVQHPLRDPGEVVRADNLRERGRSRLGFTNAAMWILLIVAHQVIVVVCIIWNANVMSGTGKMWSLVVSLVLCGCTTYSLSPCMLCLADWAVGGLCGWSLSGSELSGMYRDGSSLV